MKWFMKRRVRRSLAALGSTPDDVAGTLQSLGIRGWHRMADRCPVAVYLRGEFPGEAVTVTRDRIMVDGVHVEPPQPVRLFVNRFDLNDYPHLYGKVQGPRISEPSRR